MKFDVFYTARAPQWSPNKTKIWQPQVPLVCQPWSENQFLYWLAFKNGADSVWHGPCRILLLWEWRLYTVLLLWRRTEELGGRGRPLGKWSLVWEGLRMEVENQLHLWRRQYKKETDRETELLVLEESRLRVQETILNKYKKVKETCFWGWK